MILHENYFYGYQFSQSMNVEGEEIFLVPYPESEERIIVYVPRRSYVALISKELESALKESEPSPIAAAFLGHIQKRPSIPIEEILTESRHANPILSVALTNDCNLRCRYCYACAGDTHRQSFMSKEMIDSLLVAYFKQLALPADQSEKTRTIEIKIMGGGEPTFAFNQLEFLVDRASQLAAQNRCKCIFSMPTNGIYGDKVRKYLATHIQSISLSFDGAAHIQNLHRPLRNGGASFPIVFETAKYFHSVGASFALRATVSDYSLPFVNETVSFFTEHFPKVSISLEPLSPVGRALTDPTVKPPNERAMADALVDVLRTAPQNGQNIHNSASSEYDILRPVFCTSVAIPNWTVLVDGRIYCCDRENAPDEFLLGSFDFKEQKFVIDTAKVDAIRRMNVFNYPECADCFCKYHCAGDCPDRRLTHKSDCEAIRRVGLHVLESKIQNKKEIAQNALN